MSKQLRVAVGQFSDKGCKDINQDFHGACLPKEPQLGAKGVVVALADGISSSAVSQVASQFAVNSLLQDYYCTSDAWSVKTSIEKVLAATNSWLHAQTRHSPYRFDKERGYVCTLSAMVFKAGTAHLFHVGDARIYQVHAHSLEQLTNDHRVWTSPEQSYLARALGIGPQLDIDYRTLRPEQGDTFLLATDGVYEHVPADVIIQVIASHADDLDRAARLIVEEALRRGSTDNLTAQIARVDELPEPQAGEMVRQMAQLPFPPALEARMSFDGYRIVRQLHASSRSHVFLALDSDSGEQVALKVPSVDLRDDPAYLERFLMEEWIARRIDSPHVLKPCRQTRKRHYLYVATEYVEGQTLAQWMVDNPKPALDAVRGIVEQIARGLRAFHRKEMLHQDLRPNNIMIDRTGTVKIIDFGATRVAGLAEASSGAERCHLLGTAQFSAPEYFLGHEGTTRADQFSLGVIAYQMLSGKLPYGAEVAKCKSAADQRRLRYDSLLGERRDIPVWVDEAIRKAVQPSPDKRYEDLAEFIYDLQHPNQAYLRKARLPLMERNPVVFWKGVSFTLMLVIVMMLSLNAAVR
ncbi:bifunctional protein-serine/threonine kinase/phosphatase [Noviherbaspirillum humi]|nr:bifunctional protein-serine/threonine kinase/phosphatase [Noviherbaspirillum humi]